MTFLTNSEIHYHGAMHTRHLPVRLLTLAAAWLLTAGGASLAAAPAAAVPDDPLAPLAAAYVRAVKPGEQVDAYRELFGTVLQRVQRSYAQEVELQPMIAAALKTIAPLAPGRLSITRG